LKHVLERAPPPAGERLSYGADKLQFGELRFPPGEGPFPLLFVIHGGFWKAQYDLKHIGHLCAKFSSYGIITCSLEYRRIGDRGGGWPGTFLDIAEGVDFLFRRLAENPRVDAKRAAVIGHSAGGHLALWLGGRGKLPASSEISGSAKQGLPLVAAISLAGVADLRMGYEQNLGGVAVRKLIGGSPEQYPRRYNEGSPIELVPMGVKQILIHGTQDDTVPLIQSERFYERAKDAGDNPSFHPLDEVGHFEVIDPESKAWQAVAKPTLEVLKIDAEI
jgi:dipeptidyl aminopeptidase/acylaminoacyl peptidase